MTTPRVRRLVLFKHGVAYVERGGPADGPFELAFKRDEMNDVLKSLAVWTGGSASRLGEDGQPEPSARVGAVAFEKPEDPGEALVRRKLAFEVDGTLLGLLRSMRGRRVAVQEGDTRREGEVLGVEEPPSASGEGGLLPRRTLLLRQDAGIVLVDLARVTNLELLEQSARDDLAFFVDRSRAASTGENRIVKVDVTGRCDDLRVSYVVPAPAWRVSYRLARQGETTLLMAWGIVHNPVEEDLEDLELVLTTGQPVSFVIDLYAPKNVARAVLEEATRAVWGPTRLERAVTSGGPPPVPPRAPKAARAMAPLAMALPAPAAFGGAADDDDDERTGMTRLAEVASAASFEERGEHFEYRVGQRLALKRGGSAMVPLLAVGLAARKERIWRAGSAPAPDLVLSFANTSGAVLEEGAAVIYDGDVYAGESMVPYATRGAEVKLAYAKDLAVRCKHRVDTERSLHGIRLGEHYARVDSRTEWTHAFVVESDQDAPVEVVLELPLATGREPSPGAPAPFETTFGYRRFRVSVPAHGRVTLDVREHAFSYSDTAYTHLGGGQLDEWIRLRLLSAPHALVLQEVLGLFDEARRLAQARSDVASERERLYERQERVNQQLAVLKDAGPEAQLRVRHVRDLEATQDALRELDVRDADLAQRAREAEEAAWATLRRATASSAPA